MTWLRYPDSLPLASSTADTAVDTFWRTESILEGMSSSPLAVSANGGISYGQLVAPRVLAKTRRPPVGTRHHRRVPNTRASSDLDSAACDNVDDHTSRVVDVTITSDANPQARASRRVMLAAPPALRFGASILGAFSLGAGAAGPMVSPAVAAVPNPPLKLTPFTPTGINTLHDSLLYNGLATADRTRLRLDGLLPVATTLPSTEVLRAQAALDSCSTPMQKYRVLVSLLNTDEQTFYTLLNENTADLLPILYTPTVGDACLQYGTLIQRPPGLTVSLNDFGKIDSLLASWPHQNIKIAVITDGERILGLGDQGANGMGITAGKSMVYAACGLKPEWLLPIQVDTGTENETLLSDPLYVGDRRRRERGEKYDLLLEELVQSLRNRYGSTTIIHWEDFAPRNAFRVLQKFRNEPIKATTYNDDIQGTAAVTVAGTLASVRLLKSNLKIQRVLFFGAGQANVGAANLLTLAMKQEDPELTVQEARNRIWLMDSKGLVYKDRASDNGKLSSDKAPFAVDLSSFSSKNFDPKNLAQVVRATNCSILVGAAAIPKAFTKEVITQMSKQNKNPVIFALSNPTSKAECTAIEAYEWSGGACIFASGTKFPDFRIKNGSQRAPGFANNAFIFPGIALGSLASGASTCTDGMFLSAATTLASLVTEEQLRKGAVYPPTSTIREAAVFVGAGVAAAAAAEGVARQGVCGTGVVPTVGTKVPSLDSLEGETHACVNWEACVRDFAKTCL